MKTITFKILLMAITVTMMACGGSQNRNTNTDNTMGADSLNMNESMTDDQLGMGTNAQENTQDFIEEAASFSLMEIELSKYAQQNAVNQRVKNFAEMIVRDHSQINDELKSIASGKNITVPTTMADDHRDKMSNIQEKSGVDFDKEYIKEMIDHHEKDVDKFTKFAEEANVDTDLKSFASKTLPTLLMHQDSAKQIMDLLQ